MSANGKRWFTLKVSEINIVYTFRLENPFRSYKTENGVINRFLTEWSAVNDWQKHMVFW